MRNKNGSGRYGVRTIGIGKFGEWLTDRMKEHDITCQDLAEKLDVSRQKIQLDIKHQTCPNFINVIAYCWAFGNIDNPYEIYNLVKEDWGL